MTFTSTAKSRRPSCASCGDSLDHFAIEDHSAHKRRAKRRVAEAPFACWASPVGLDGSVVQISAVLINRLNRHDLSNKEWVA